MKRFYSLIIALIPSALFAQTVFWTEDFGSGCNQTQLATATTGPNGSWTMTDTGPNGSAPNTWYISAGENGNAVGTCGTSCGNNRTLHISNTFFHPLFAPYDPDAKAIYYLTGTAGLCDVPPLNLGCGMTDKRIESPTINCTGRSTITVNFQYIEGGNTIDGCTMWYSANNGGAWTQIDAIPKTVVCNTDRGIWAAHSVALPATADNNPSVKIGFRWVNTEDSPAPHDPSFAIDNITLSVPEVACCDGDFNCDGVINVLDMIIIVNQFGCAAACTADLNNDGLIGAADLTIFNGLYGTICP